MSSKDDAPDEAIASVQTEVTNVTDGTMQVKRQAKRQAKRPVKRPVKQPAKNQRAAGKHTSAIQSSAKENGTNEKRTVKKSVQGANHPTQTATPQSQSAQNTQNNHKTVNYLKPQIVSKSEPEGTQPTITSAGENQTSTKPTNIVAIGASAGGLQPLEDFFRSMPADTGFSFVVVQHLSPDFKSLMQELLARQTNMDIERARQGMALKPNTIYLIPPRKNMTIKNSQLQLTEQNHAPGHGPNFPIDLFFRSLAKDCGKNAIGIILSGTGTDGSRGVRAIDEAGGLVFVQSTDSAQFDGMPIAAIVTGIAHEVMPPAEIATALSDIATTHTYETPVYDEQQAELFDKIIELVAEHRGIDFRLYKPSTITRRLERRRLIAGSESLAHYHELLLSNADELSALRTDLLVSVTSFFRDEPAWRKLKDNILPTLIKHTPEHETIRVWVTACATGEEAYTAAIVLREVLDDLGRHYQEAKIFATDVDEPALERAAQGKYPSSVVADVPPKLLEKYFVADGHFYQVSRQLREMIIFAPHNLLEDAPFTRTHFVTCRNALIYLQKPVQTHIIRMLHFSLCSGGILFLGPSESTGDLAKEFNTLDHHWSIQEKIRNLRLSNQTKLQARLPPLTAKPSAKFTRSHGDTSSQHLKDSLINSAFTALAFEESMLYVVCDAEMNMLHAVGDTRPFLEIPQGTMTNDITQLVPGSLSIPLSTAMNRAKREERGVNYYAITNSADPSISIDIKAIHRPAVAGSIELYIVLLKKAAEPNPQPASFNNIENGNGNGNITQRLRDQEVELEQTRENLQSTIEQLETTNEIHQTTNEQLTTANEELQSTNEELHSVNEELYTVNSEYQVKINELTELNNDIDNLLESTDIGVVFLDDHLNIRKFTPAATHSVRLLPNDIGRPFEDLTYNFDYPALATDVRRVLSLGEAIEREAAIDDTHHILVRIHPYRAGNELTVGVVISFIDISELKHVEDALAQVEIRYRHLFQSDMFGIVVSNIESRTVIDANDTFLRLIDGDRGMLPLKHQQVFPENDLGSVSLAMEELLASGTTPPTPARLLTRDDRIIPVIISRTLISQKEQTYVSFVIDATELNQKQREIQLKTDEMEAVSGNLQQFAYIASHELLEPLRSLAGYSTILSERYASKLDANGEQYLNFILQSASQMSRVVDDLLLFSRVHTTGHPFTNFSSLDSLNQVISELNENTDGLNIYFDVQELPYIYADELQFQQLVMALLENSVKFRSHQPVEIKVNAVTTEDLWRFEISDNGIGIDPSHTENIFSIFKRLHPRDAYPGSGVGLAICRRIIDRHNGKIWAESSNVSGATIFFTIPKQDIIRTDSALTAKPDRI